MVGVTKMAEATVRYLNWWSDFDPKSSFIPRLLQQAVGQELRIITDPRLEVDYEVHSVFCVNGAAGRIQMALHRRSKEYERRRAAMLRADYGIDDRGPAKKYIWYTGENLRPPTDWDVTLSFDLDPLLGGNWYLPHWAIRLGDLGGHDPKDQFIADNHTLTQRRTPTERRSKFAVLLAGNPHPMRSALHSALSSIGEADTFGTAYGRPVSSKIELFSQYRFAIVPENDLYPGYVTEKAVEAWLAGCVPIWWGSDPSGFLNRNALFNLAEMTLDELVQHVQRVDEDMQELEFMTSEPILQRPYDFVSCVKFVASRLLSPST